MKKLTLSVFAMVMMAFVACGPSAEEKEAAEKARMDSIANVEAEMRRAADDSMMAAQQAITDSINAATQKALEDSIALLKGSVKQMQQKNASDKKKEEKKIEDKKTQQNQKG